MTTERATLIVATETTVDADQVEVTPVAVAVDEPVEGRYNKAPGTPVGDFATGEEKEQAPGTLRPVGDFATGEEKEQAPGTLRPVGDFATGEEAAPLDASTAPADFAAGQEK